MDPRFAGPGGTWAGGPSSRDRNYATAFREHDSLISSYENLSGLPDSAEALHRLRKIASMVKPIMRKRGWQVHTITEFLPEDARLLGLNVNRGQKICIRLRWNNDKTLFLPLEQTVDTMLHELCHIVIGPHNGQFQALWDELRDEHETLLMKGFTGEGFLSKGHKLGGGGRMPPDHELRRLARQSAEERHRRDKQAAGSGRKLGGHRVRPGEDPRRAIVEAISRRTSINQGCASGSQDAGRLAEQQGRDVFTTQGEEDDNDRAIAEALFELMEEEEQRKLTGTFADSASGGLTWTPGGGLSESQSRSTSIKRKPVNGSNGMSEEEQLEWALQESMRGARSTPEDRAASAPPAVTDSQDPSNNDEPATGLRTYSNHSGSRPSSRNARSDLETHSDSGRSLKRKSHDTSIAPAAAAAARPASSLYSSETESHTGTLASLNSRTTGHESTGPDPVELASALTAAEHPMVRPSADPPAPSSSGGINTWTCEICTCINPLQFLACDACGIERPATAVAPVGRRMRPVQQNNIHPAAWPAPATLGWTCTRCASFMEHRWWSCSQCGQMKSSSVAREHLT